MARPKKENKSPIKPKESILDKLSLADGKTDESKINDLRSLEKILDIKKTNPFGTTDLATFKEMLSEMTTTDMKKIFDKIGLFPSGSRMELKERLLREFKTTTQGVLSYQSQSPQFTLDPNNPSHKKLLKIINDV